MMLKNTIRLVLNRLTRLRNLLPSKIPTGLTEFKKWSQSIVDVYEFPNNPSLHFTIATILLHHVNPSQDTVAKARIASKVRRGMANQLAVEVMRELKAEQDRLDKEAAAKQQAASTNVETPVSSL